MKNRLIKSTLQKYHSMSIPAKAAIWFVVCSVLQKGISVLSTPIFTRLLSTAEYGQYNLFNSWMGIANIFVTLMLFGGVYTQGLVKFDKDRAIFTSALEGLTFTMFVFWVIVYLLFHDFWNKMMSLSTVQGLAMLLMIWTSSIFSFWAAEQRAEYQYKKLVFLTLLVSVAKPVVGVIAVLTFDDKVTARILGLVIVEFVAYIWLFISQMTKGKVFFSSKYWKYALCFNIPLVPHYLSQTVLNSSDRIMIGSMIGESEAGIYSLAYSLSSMMLLFNTAIIGALSPWIYEKIKERKIKEIENIAYISLIVIASINLLLMLVAPEVVAIFAPGSYYDAIYIIPPVAMSVFFLFSYDLFAKFAFYYEKTFFVTVVSVIGAISNIVLNYIFISAFGYVAAGYTTLICYMLYCLGHYLYMRKIVNDECDGIQPFDLKIYITITICFLLSGFCILATYRFKYLRYILIVLICIGTIICRKQIIRVLSRIRGLKNKN